MGGFGTGFDIESCSNLLDKSSGFLCLYLPLGLLVCPSANQKQYYLFFGILCYLIDPLLKLLETLFRI